MQIIIKKNSNFLSCQQVLFYHRLIKYVIAPAVSRKKSVATIITSKCFICSIIRSSKINMITAKIIANNCGIKQLRIQAVSKAGNADAASSNNDTAQFSKLKQKKIAATPRIAITNIPNSIKLSVPNDYFSLIFSGKFSAFLLADCLSVNAGHKIHYKNIFVNARFKNLSG